MSVKPLRRLFALVLAAALSSMLIACAPRPATDTLTPVASVQGLKLVTIHVATTRTSVQGAPMVFTNGRARELSYARYVVSIPTRHKSAEIEWPTGKPNPAESFAVVSAEPLLEDQFEKEVSSAAARGRTRRRDAGLFVHGYNYSFQESLFRAAQLQADADLGGALVLFAWPSLGEITGYVADRDAMTYSRDGLAHVVQKLATAHGSNGVTLFAHSMGGWLSLEAVRQLRLQGRNATLARLNDVVLAAPDIDIDVLRQQLKVIGRLRSPITLLVSKDDKALSFSRLLAGDRKRAGTADIHDPLVWQAVSEERLRVIDISRIRSADGFDHDRYASLAAVFPRLQSLLDRRSKSNAAKAGTFVLDGGTTTISNFLRI